MDTHAGSVCSAEDKPGIGWFVCTLRNETRGASPAFVSENALVFFGAGALSVPEASRSFTPPRETVAATVAPARNGYRNRLVAFAASSKKSSDAAAESSTPSTANENAPSFLGKPRISRPAIMDRSESTSIHGQWYARFPDGTCVTSSTTAASWYAPQQNESGYLRVFFFFVFVFRRRLVKDVATREADAERTNEK